MQHGFLWYGRHVESLNIPHSTPSPSEVDVERPESVHPEACSSSLDFTRTIEPRRKESALAKSLMHNDAIQNQLCHGLLATKLRSAFLAIRYAQTHNLSQDPLSAVADVGAHVTFMSMMAWRHLAEPQIHLSQAIFNVDRPAKVLTPFHPNYESIPHPEERSMSISWLVEKPIDEETIDTKSSKERVSRERLRTIGLVKGVWKIMQHDSVNSMNYVILV